MGLPLEKRHDSLIARFGRILRAASWIHTVNPNPEWFAVGRLAGNGLCT